ncbi:VOC family protein [Paenibacillus sp. FJAT-26967]|uniref:VOC family protein n=1 Tax=Paenibacillus sp. FJAT-26967 TaxID=1729690 RepID=UPI000A8D7763|nr:VOC family protein [Paenibacillus sp. FJAT-26967]
MRLNSLDVSSIWGYDKTAYIFWNIIPYFDEGADLLTQGLLTGIDHVQLPAADLEESIAWYCRVFGFSLLENYGEFAMLTLNDRSPNLMLWQSKNYSSAHFEKDGETLPVLFFRSSEIDKLATKLQEENARIVSFDDGGFAKFLKFYDLNNNFIGVMQLMEG